MRPYLSGGESLVSAADLSGIDLQLSSPSLDQVLLEDSQSWSMAQRLELAIIIRGDAEGHWTRAHRGVGCVSKRIIVSVHSSNILAHLHIRNLEIHKVI